MWVLRAIVHPLPVFQRLKRREAAGQSMTMLSRWMMVSP